MDSYGYKMHFHKSSRTLLRINFMSQGKPVTSAHSRAERRSEIEHCLKAKYIGFTKTSFRTNYCASCHGEWQTDRGMYTVKAKPAALSKITSYPRQVKPYQVSDAKPLCALGETHSRSHRITIRWVHTSMLFAVTWFRWCSKYRMKQEVKGGDGGKPVLVIVYALCCSSQCVWNLESPSSFWNSS